MTLKSFKQYYPDTDLEFSQSFTKEDWDAAIESIAGYPRDLYGIKEPVDIETALAYIAFDYPDIPINAKTGRYVRGKGKDEYGDDPLKEIFMICKTERPIGE